MWPRTPSQAVDRMQCMLAHRKLVGLAILKKPVHDIPRFTHYLRFPQFLDHAISVSSALAGRLTELTSVVSMQVALECLAHDWNLNPRVVPAIYWSFIHVPAHLLMALIVSLVAYASMLAGCGERQCTSACFLVFAKWFPFQTPWDVALLFPCRGAASISASRRASEGVAI